MARTAVVLYFLLIGLNSAWAASFPYAADGFSFPLEGGWVEIPKQTLADYDYGFQRQAGPPWRSLPYVLIQVKNIGRITPETFLKWSGESDKLNADFKKIYGENVEVESVKMDPAKPILWMRLHLGLEGTNPVKCLAAAVLTEKGLLQINGFSEDDDAERNFALFEGMVRAIEFEPELAYRLQVPRENVRHKVGRRSPFTWVSLAFAGGALFFLGFKIAEFAYRKLAK